MDREGRVVILPDRLLVGVSRLREESSPDVPLLEIGSDFADLPTPQEVRRIGGDAALTLIGWHVLTHRRTDPRYRQMKAPIPEHAAVGHFERSRWTDEAWEHTDTLARATDAQAVVFQTPASFRATPEHATRFENFVAHATRPGLALGWEWPQGSWPEKKALSLCDRIGALPVVDPTESPIPDGELIYLRFRGGRSGRRALKDDELKKVALAVRDRIGWVVFSNSTRVQDARRLLQMI